MNTTDAHDGRPTFASRLVAAVLVAAVVASVAYYCAWRNYRKWEGFRGLQDMTERELDHVQERVELERAVTGKLPGALAEIRDWELVAVHLDERKQPVDVWWNAIQYETNGDRFVVYSFGRDGRPGGDGLDGDLYPRSSGRPRPVATLWQFTADPEARGIQTSCVLAGAFAGLVCLLPAHDRRHCTRPSWGRFLIRIAVTAVAAVVGALVISVLHLPTGH
jgi:hypothetical protein